MREIEAGYFQVKMSSNEEKDREMSVGLKRKRKNLALHEGQRGTRSALVDSLLRW